MKLIVNELQTSLFQQITTGTRAIQLYAIRPHLYRHGSPSGSLTVQVQDSGGKLIAASETLACTAVGSGTYWHGDQRFLIGAELAASTIYRVALVASGGYSFSESAYVGWCLDYDLRKVPATYSPSTNEKSAHLLELWESRETWGRIG